MKIAPKNPGCWERKCLWILSWLLVLAILSSGCTQAPSGVQVQSPAATQSGTATIPPAIAFPATAPPTGKPGSEPGTGTLSCRVPQSTDPGVNGDDLANSTPCLLFTFISVDQGDAILVRSPGGRTMLIDAGTQEHGSGVVTALRRQGITSVDILVATHPHGDHIGGMPAVVAGFPVGLFIQGPLPCNSADCHLLHAALEQRKIPVREVRSGAVIPFDPAMNVTVLNPPPVLFDEVNDNSLVLRIRYENATFLLTGDAGKTAEAGMLSAGSPIRADLLKVGHHGLSSSTSVSFVSHVHPEISVISLGKSTSPTHPDPGVINRLRQSGSAVYRTDIDGTVTVLSDGSALEVTTGVNRTPAWYPVATTGATA